MNPDSVYHLVIDSMPSNGISILDILTAIFTGIIAVFAAIIAYQQYRINRQRFKFETYDRKLGVYKSVQKFLRDILREGKTDYPKLFEFYEDASETIFLFENPNPIVDKIEEIYKKGNRMIYLSQKLYPRDGAQGLPVGDERSKVANEESELLQWHVEQLKEVRELFREHIQLK
jgi:hypothetical protein